MAADGGSKVVAVSEVAAPSSEVLRRLPHRDAADPPTNVPFSAVHVQAWAAGAPELLVSFEAALSVLKVCFLGPTRALPITIADFDGTVCPHGPVRQRLYGALTVR